MTAPTGEPAPPFAPRTTATTNSPTTTSSSTATTHADESRIHKPGAIAFGVTFLSTCLIAADIGYGNTVALGICLATAALGPVVDLLFIGRQRTRYLHGLRRG
ncbi:hypothetical protein ACFC0M_21080 [Streptomyces sp. NPDC056149]|uniref:hypothetical protein n=1 Tax=Streptomyces sp. NPDC056149 TaxID=3345728 RepID=UPI0035DE6024